MSGYCKCVTCGREVGTSFPSERFVCQTCITVLTELYKKYPELKLGTV
jgi:DNA-directed RNA polymerase subunit N (RpoN/RPB10)